MRDGDGALARPNCGGAAGAARAWGINPYEGAVYARADARLWGARVSALDEPESATSALITVDLERRALFFSINVGLVLRAAAVRLPPAVRPWVLLRRPGACATIKAYEALAPPAAAMLPTDGADALPPEVARRWAELEAHYAAPSDAGAQVRDRDTRVATPEEATFRRLLGEAREDAAALRE